VEIEAAAAGSGGPPRTFTARLEGIRPGADVEVGAPLVVAREMEGGFTANLAVRGPGEALLFEGTYDFGYPRYAISRGLRLLASGAHLRDAFDGPALDERTWKKKVPDAGRARVEVKDGRLWIHAAGPMSHNGVFSDPEVGGRDVVLVCRAGIEAQRGAEGAAAESPPHAALVHLCGQSRRSPDHWIEVELRAADGGGAEAALGAQGPPYPVEVAGRVALPGRAADGCLVKIVNDGATHRARAYVRTADRWEPVGDPVYVPTRHARVELKTRSAGRGEGATDIWFDDCRLYPRPETHLVTVSLRRADGSALAARLPGAWPPVAYGPGNGRLTHRAVLVKPFTSDGATLVDAVSVTPEMGFAALSLEKAPWDVYPASAVLRVFAGEAQVGPDHVIESRGLLGLYPDDVYALTLE
jgi:hypothetical protein